MRAARYIRISTKNQKYERQLQNKYPNEIIYLDIVSGITEFKKRPRGAQLYREIIDNKIDKLFVHSIDRLGRNTLDILSTLDFLNKHKVNLRVENLGIESLVQNKPNMVFKLIISVLANVYEMERETLLERQQEGIKLAKLNGKYKGRLKGSSEDIETFLLRHKKTIKLIKRKYSLRNVAKLCGISLSTVQKVKRLYYSRYSS